MSHLHTFSAVVCCQFKKIVRSYPKTNNVVKYSCTVNLNVSHFSVDPEVMD